MNYHPLPTSFYLIVTTFLVERLNVAVGSVPSSNETDGHVQTLRIMVVVPTTEHFDGYCKCQLPKWERGEEILPGVHIAVSEINSSPVILRNFRLEIVPIKVPLCSASTAINAFVGNLTSQTNNIVAITGYFYDNLAQGLLDATDLKLFRFLLYLRSYLGQIITLICLTFITSVDVYTKAIVMLIKTLGWRQIGVISNSWYHDIHLSRIKEVFTSVAHEHGTTIVLHEESNPANSINKILQDLKNSYGKVIVAFLPPSEAIEILCIQGFKWPNYVWLFVEVSSDEMIKMTNKNYYDYGSGKCHIHLK